jgi:type II secretory pathway component PulC
MRLAVVFLSVALIGSIAAADEAKPARPRVPLRLVRVLPDTQQAVMFDKNRGTHVLVELGKKIAGYTVADIDDDAVTLETSGGAQIVLVAPSASDTTPRVREVREVREVEAPQHPVDPYAAPTEHPLDPYGDPPVRVVEAPPAPVPVLAPVPVPAPAPDSLVLPRADLDLALSDFSKLSHSALGTFTPTGFHVDSVLDGSLFAKVGIRANDTIASVDNIALRSLDDAAQLYAHASTARNVTIQLVRAGKPITLKVTIR